MVFRTTLLALSFLLSSFVVYSQNVDKAFYDDFSKDNDNWYVGKSDKVEYKIEDGYYKLSNFKSIERCLSTRKYKFSGEYNYSIEIKIKNVGGPGDQGYGIAYQYKDWENKSLALISAGQYAKCYHEVNDRSEVLYKPQKNSFINKKDEWNILKVVVKDETVTFTVNDHEVFSKKLPTTLYNAKIGFFVGKEQKVIIDYVKAEILGKAKIPEALDEDNIEMYYTFCLNNSDLKSNRNSDMMAVWNKKTGENHFYKFKYYSNNDKRYFNSFLDNMYSHKWSDDWDIFPTTTEAFKIPDEDMEELKGNDGDLMIRGETFQASEDYKTFSFFIVWNTKTGKFKTYYERVDKLHSFKSGLPEDALSSLITPGSEVLIDSEVGYPPNSYGTNFILSAWNTHGKGYQTYISLIKTSKGFEVFDEFKSYSHSLDKKRFESFYNGYQTSKAGLVMMDFGYRSGKKDIRLLTWTEKGLSSLYAQTNTSNFISPAKDYTKSDKFFEGDKHKYRLFFEPTGDASRDYKPYLKYDLAVFDEVTGNFSFGNFKEGYNYYPFSDEFIDQAQSSIDRLKTPGALCGLDFTVRSVSHSARQFRILAWNKRTGRMVLLNYNKTEKAIMPMHKSHVNMLKNWSSYIK